MDGSKKREQLDCPAVSSLAAMLQLPENDSYAILMRQHLSECAACQRKLDELTRSELLEDFRQTFVNDKTCLSDSAKRILDDVSGRIAEALITDAESATTEIQDIEASVVETEKFPAFGVTTQPRAERRSEALPGSIGPYAILRELGRGGAGVVFLAFDDKTGRKIALKTIAVSSAEQRERLQREAKAAASLQVEEVVRLHSVEENADGTPFLTMEFVDGPSLDEHIANHDRLQVDQAVDICLSIARALQAAHSNDILHRDVKPGNILINEEGKAKLTDFGLADLGERVTNLTQTGVLVGTPVYMSPEQASGQTLGPASDIYSLGCVLYECLAGTAPFQGTSHQVLRQIAEDEPVPLTRLNENVPTDVQTICAKAMHKNPERRYRSAGQFASDLMAWKKGDSIAARPDTAIEKCQRWYRKNKRVAWMAGTIGALLLATSIGSMFAVSWIAQESQRAHEASQDAKQSARLAAEQRQLALETLRGLVFNVDNQLRDYPNTLEVRTSILESALSGLRQVVDESNQVEVDHSTVAAQIQIGEILMSLGRDVQAKQQFEIARSLAEERYHVKPDDDQASADFAGALVGLGDQCRAAFDFVGAEKHYRQAIVVRKQVVARDPDSVANQIELSRALVRLGDALVGQNDDKGAADLFRQSLDILDRYPVEVDQDVSYQRSLSVTLNSLSQVAIRAGDIQSAQRYSERLGTTAEDLLNRYPNNPAFKLDKAISVSQLSRIAMQLNEPNDAWKYAREATLIHREIVQSDPGNSWARSNLGIQLHFEALAAFTMAEFDKAHAAWRENLDIQRALLQENPGNTRFAMLAAEASVFLTSVAIRTGDLAKSAKYIDGGIAIFRSMPGQATENPAVTNALTVYRLLSDAIHLALETESLKVQDVVSASDTEKVGQALFVYNSLFDGEVGSAIELANELANHDSSSSVSGSQIDFCLAAIYAKLAVIVGEDEGKSSIRIAELNKKALDAIERYLKAGNLLANVQGEPDFRQLRMTDAYAQRLKEWTPSTSADNRPVEN